MSKKTIRKAAQITAAGLLPATAMTVVSQTAADASVTITCGRNFSPSKATYAYTVEKVAPKAEGAFGTYPAISIRSGEIDGDPNIYWARESDARWGDLDLDWWGSANGTTHEDCRLSLAQSEIPTRNYTQGVLYGWNNPPGQEAFDFRPCMDAVSPTSDAPPSVPAWGPWDCGPWYQPSVDAAGA